MAKVSVIIPVYNTEKYLRRCLDSVCNQTVKDIEIICVNDCSPDNCLDVLREYAECDNRIKLIDFAENKGVSIARNTGIDAATGEYIGFVDSDDFIDLDFYEKLYTKAVETDADAVKGGMLCKKENRECNFEREVGYDSNADIKNHFAYFYHSFTTAIYNTSFIKNNNICFPESISNFEDPYFSIIAGMCYKKVEVVDSVKYYYVDNASSLTKNINDKKAIEAVNAINQLINKLNKSHITQEHSIIVFNFLLKHLLPFCLNKNFSTHTNREGLETLSNLYANIKNKEDFIYYHFLREKKMRTKLILAYAKNKFSKSKIGLK